MFSRTELLIGKDSLNKLKSSHIVVFGIGGVGGYVVESLARSGVEYFTLFDSDNVSLSNLNRQIIATTDTVGRDKTEVMKERILSINKNAQVICEKVFYLPENADTYDLTKYDYIVDAVDTVTAKLEIITRAKKNNVKVISCMGTGGKLNPTMLKVADISKTSTCPLARVMRRELRARGIDSLKVVYSEEVGVRAKEKGKEIPSMAFVPATAGLIIASEIVKDIIKGE